MQPEIAKQPVKPPRLSMKMLHDLITEHQQIHEQLMKRIEVLEQQLSEAVPAPQPLPAAMEVPVKADKSPSSELESQVKEVHQDIPSQSYTDIMNAEMPELDLEELVQATLRPDVPAPLPAEHTQLALADRLSSRDPWSCIEIPRSLRHAAPAKKKRIWDKLWHWGSTRESGSQSVTHRRDAQRTPHPRLSLEMPHEPMRLRSSSE